MATGAVQKGCRQPGRARKQLKTPTIRQRPQVRNNKTRTTWKSR
eukprot:CAMPEP_0204166878 /NCGR_PEP_ID=MMETSP0361-20130328/39383_1 /ASSEMBLY_ACC=CAM_ASM_000343 /TAXON_ID=268821 /ORGANISM="Scrippsiella Hangoei, Strain SHTV-5" /LENGTH=43 /DNA_ID= /DNA_START= /DNA_END= /DNA_ORIENTATION=